MTNRVREDRLLSFRRRDILKYAASASVVGILAPGYLGRALAQGDDLAPYTSAKVNWKQAEGEQITVAVIPASYFENLIGLQPQFEALTGIKLRFEKVPPGQIRQKAMLDLSSKTATYATHAADPMYYSLYVSNKWVEPLDKYLSDASLTDPAWYKYDDIIKAWRDADSVDGKPYGIPYDGEVTVQVYRKDLYDAKGLKPADTFDQIVANVDEVSIRDSLRGEGVSIAKQAELLADAPETGANEEFLAGIRAALTEHDASLPIRRRDAVRHDSWDGLAERVGSLLGLPEERES